MRRRGGMLAVGTAALGLLCALPAAEPADEGYTPVTAPAALHAALRSSLKAVRDWLGGKDFASAAQEAQTLTALARLYAFQGADAGWRDRTATLADTSARLAGAAGKEDAAACDKLARECGSLLDDLAGRSPGVRKADAGFQLRGSTRTWMLLLDAAFTEAKYTKDRRGLELFARAVAEEANAVQYLRTAARWRQSCRDVRAAALEAAAKAAADDLPAARSALKTVSRHCEACHEQSNRR